MIIYNQVLSFESQFPDFPDFLEKMKNQQEMFSFQYLSKGYKIQGYAMKPKDGRKLPVIVYNRGGTRQFGALREASLYTQFGRLSQRGFLVIGSQYYEGPRSEGRDEYGGLDVNAIHDLIPVIESLGGDVKNIGIYGESRGGMMSFLALKQGFPARSVFVNCPITNLCSRGSERLLNVFVHCFGGSNEQKRIRSPLYFVSDIPKIPLYILQAGKDWRVDPQDSIHFYEALLEASHDCELDVVESADHCFMGDDAVYRNKKIISFFQKTLF